MLYNTKISLPASGGCGNFAMKMATTICETKETAQSFLPITKQVVHRYKRT